MSMIGHNQNTTTDVNSLSSEQKQTLKKAIQELNDSLTKVAAEREFQSETIKEVASQLNLDKKLVRRLAKTYFKANFNTESEDNKVFEEFYTMLMTAMVK